MGGVEVESWEWEFWELGLSWEWLGSFGSWVSVGVAWECIGWELMGGVEVESWEWNELAWVMGVLGVGSELGVAWEFWELGLGWEWLGSVSGGS